MFQDYEIFRCFHIENLPENVRKIKTSWTNFGVQKNKYFVS